MSIEEFKIIFWWEWIHRFLGRLIGLGFFGIMTGYIGTLILKKHEPSKLLIIDIVIAVSYTHLTLPTNREV